MRILSRSAIQSLMMIVALALNWGIAPVSLAASWMTNAPMGTARQFHTATLLTNGQVLVTGGQDGNLEYSATAELYDPITGSWRPTGTMNDARVNHTATLLPDGRVLVAGGFNDISFLSTAELYDPLGGLWSSVGSMTNARSKHTATLLPNGKVLVAGGEDNIPLHEAEIFDPSLGVWTPASPLIYARGFHSATLLTNGTVLVAGGREVGGGILKSAELYDPAADTWASTGDMSLPRWWQPAALLANGKVLVVGGDPLDAELYDPVTGTWLSTAEINPWLSPWGYSLTLLPNGKALMAGGFNQAFAGVTDARAWLFDPTTLTWIQTASLNVGRYVHTATLLPNGNVLVTGGGGDDPWRLASVELYSFLDPIALTGSELLPNGAFQVSFTNTPGASFSAMATTNLALPLSNWTALGGVTEGSPGQFQFTDPQATNRPQRFYRVRAN